VNLFDWINSTSAQALTAFQTFMTLACAVIAVWVAGRGGYTFAKILMAGLGAGVILFFIWGGHLWVRDLLQGTTGA
jgi:hypothetical protein